MWTLQCGRLSRGVAWALGHKGLVAPPCGILVPQPGMEPSSPGIARWVLSHWTTKEVPHLLTAYYTECQTDILTVT